MLQVHIDGKTLVSDRDLTFSHEKKLQNITLFKKKEHYNQTYFDFFRTYFDLSIRLFLWFTIIIPILGTFFQKNISFVGCTRQLDRLRYLIDCLNNYTIKKKFDIKFSNKLSFVTKSDYTIHHSP